MLTFHNFPASGSNRAITVAGGKTSVGRTEYIEIHDESGLLDNTKATSIKDDSTRYRFVTATFGKTKTYTFR